MAPLRMGLLLVSTLLLCCAAMAQDVRYPADASTLLRSTAGDVAELLQRAIPGSQIEPSPYTERPASGIVLVYDEHIGDNQACRVKRLGPSLLLFEAAEDNGLVFGLYQYLHELGYRFWQPGSIWEQIPALNSPYRDIDTLYTCALKYKTWFMSGGHNKWALDNDSRYDWDLYFGKNGHAWAQYQRRNGMLGAYRFAGHRGDLMEGEYLDTLKNNPCLVAPYNGSRLAGVQSVPDVNNPQAMDLWGKAISTRYLHYRQTILNNKSLYPDLFRSFRYNQGNLGIEVPDGAHWANSRDAAPCQTGALHRESDQQFILANHTVSGMRYLLPGMRYQVYAYDTHADFPSAQNRPASQIDVQVVPSAFQFETSTRGLLNRWYGKNVSLSEYHYLNIAQWSGETPSFRLTELKNTLRRVKEHHTQGIVWEAAPSKFASLPYLLAANNYLLRQMPVDSTLDEFCRSLFGRAHATIYRLLQDWSSADVVNLNNGIQDNKYKIPHYLRLIQTAESQLLQGSTVEKQRLRELKAYLHYMVLYYDWHFEQSQDGRKEGLAAALCTYLARANGLQLVNSYALLNMVVQPYGENHPVYHQFNTTNGNAYQTGNLQPLRDAEIEANFQNDLNRLLPAAGPYRFFGLEETAEAMDRHGLQPLDEIKVKIGYTQGKNYTHRSEFFIYARKAGRFSVQYVPRFDMPEQGSINITVEWLDHPLGVLTDFTIGRNQGAGNLDVNLPRSGVYRMSVVSKFQAAVALNILTRGHHFLKHDAFLGNTVENYRAHPESLPGYFFIPPGIDRVQFSLNNSNPAGRGHAGEATVTETFRFTGPDSRPLKASLVNGKDSALFYLPVPANADGLFFRAEKMEQYRMCLANVSNFYWYARKKDCCETTEGQDLKAWPNPGPGMYRFSLAGEPALVQSAQVFSSSGVPVQAGLNGGLLDIRHLPAGLYFYRISYGSRMHTGKLIKN